MTAQTIRELAEIDHQRLTDKFAQEVRDEWEEFGSEPLEIFMSMRIIGKWIAYVRLN